MRISPSLEASARTAALLPALKLVEKLVLLLQRQRLPARNLAALVNELDEDVVKCLLIERRRGRHRVALQPSRRRRKALPARQLCREVDLVPLRMMRRFLQPRELGE